MKRLSLILVAFLFTGCVNLSNVKGPPSITPPPGLRSDGARGIIVEGAVTMGTSHSDPADTAGEVTVTIDMLKRGKINDKDLTAASDFVLPGDAVDVDGRVVIVTGTHTISLVPPTGEALWSNQLGWLDENDEIDLTKTEGHCFSLIREYSATKSGYVWRIYTVYGTQTDGGPAD